MTDPDKAVERPCYLLLKRGLYYRPEAKGYTGIRDHAGRYTRADAETHADPVSGVTMMHEDEAPMFSPKCFPDVARDHLLTALSAKDAELAKAREALEQERSYWQEIVRGRDEWIVELIQHRKLLVEHMRAAMSEAIPDAMIFAGHPDEYRYRTAADGLRAWRATALDLIASVERGEHPDKSRQALGETK